MMRNVKPFGRDQNASLVFVGVPPIRWLVPLAKAQFVMDQVNKLFQKILQQIFFTRDMHEVTLEFSKSPIYSERVYLITL